MYYYTENMNIFFYYIYALEEHILRAFITRLGQGARKPGEMVGGGRVVGRGGKEADDK